MADSATAQRNLTPKQEAFVAFYLGECRLNATQAAIKAGYSPHTATAIGAENLTKPHIKQAIQEWRETVKSRGIAQLEYRIARLDELEQGYFEVIAARKQAYAKDDKVIGGDTGLVIRQYKMVGGGENAMLVEEYVADVAVTKEIRAIYDDAAKEMGQRVEKSETKHDATEAFMEALRGFGERNA